MIWVVTSSSEKRKILNMLTFRTPHWSTKFLIFLNNLIVVFDYEKDFIPKQVKEMTDICLCDFDMNKVKVEYLTERYHIDVFGISVVK